MKSQLVIASLFAACVASAQDIASFLPMNNLLDVNPSFAGSNGGARIQANYVNIWPSLSGRRLYNSVVADISVNHGKSGIALYANRTNYTHGVQINNNLGVGYAHRFSVKNGDVKIVPSAQVGFVNSRLDVNSLGFGVTTGPIDPSHLSKNNFEINTGFLVQVKEKFSVGCAAFHINTPDVGVVGPSKLGTRSVLHASYNFINEHDQVINLFGSYTYQYGFDNVTLACSAILKKHYYIVLSGKHQTFSDAGTMGFGWRNDFWSAMLAYNVALMRNYGTGSGSYQLACAWNIRGKEHVHGMSALENW
jgi:type IX secretion system PorP/SprF family membrane protein